MRKLTLEIHHTNGTIIVDTRSEYANIDEFLAYFVRTSAPILISNLHGTSTPVAISTDHIITINEAGAWQ